MDFENLFSCLCSAQFSNSRALIFVAGLEEMWTSPHPAAAKICVLFTVEVCFSSVPCCFVVSFAEQPDKSCCSLEIWFALRFLNGEAAENDDSLGMTTRIRAMGCPLVLHNTVPLSSGCFNLIRTKWVKYFSSCFVSGACSSSVGRSFDFAGDQAEHCPPFPACTATDLAPLTRVPRAVRVWVSGMDEQESGSACVLQSLTSQVDLLVTPRAAR